MDDVERDLRGLLAGHERAAGLATVGRGLRDAAVSVVERFIRRLRADPALPRSQVRSSGDFEDHVASYVTDLAQALVAIGEDSADLPGLLRDGIRIQDLISRLHGLQRARLHWTESMLVREFTILREEIDSAVRQYAPDPADLRAAMALINWHMSRAERLTMQEWRAEMRHE